MTAAKGVGSGGYRAFDPERCCVTIYNCCTVNLTLNSPRASDMLAHQCHEKAVSRGLCLHHLSERKRLSEPQSGPRTPTL
jgi:hypothetical protein